MLLAGHVADIFYRYATQDIELGGETIGKGSTVVVSLPAADHDPRRFDNPDTLDIHRKARGQPAFGHGVHQCFGSRLARIEMRAGFTGLLRRFPTLELAVPAGEVRLRTNMNIYGVHELPVTWTETAPWTPGAAAPGLPGHGSAGCSGCSASSSNRATYSPSSSVIRSSEKRPERYATITRAFASS